MGVKELSGDSKDPLPNMVHKHSGVFSHKKARNPVICDNMNGPGGYYVR
jgi:hypothetical protein